MPVSNVQVITSSARFCIMFDHGRDKCHVWLDMKHKEPIVNETAGVPIFYRKVWRARTRDYEARELQVDIENQILLGEAMFIAMDDNLFEEAVSRISVGERALIEQASEKQRTSFIASHGEALYEHLVAIVDAHYNDGDAWPEILKASNLIDRLKKDMP